MAKIFINYRREDSSPYVGRLVDHLEQLFKDGEVFRDIKSIVPGANFKKAIDRAIQTFDYILVMIGPDWLSILKERVTKGTSDYVRLEIASALKQGKKVIPVFVGKASMPLKKDLPKDIRALHAIQGIELTDGHFKNDVQKLVETMGGSKGTFKMFFEFPISQVYMNERYFLVVLKGPNYTRFWNVVSEKNRVAVRPTNSSKRLPERTFKLNLGVVEKPDPAPSSLELNLRSGHYQLMVTLKGRKGKIIKTALLVKEQFKSASFDLRNGETVAFKAILKMERDELQRFTYKLELESY